MALMHIRCICGADLMSNGRPSSRRGGGYEPIAEAPYGADAYLMHIVALMSNGRLSWRRLRAYCGDSVWR